MLTIQSVSSSKEKKIATSQKCKVFYVPLNILHCFSEPSLFTELSFLISYFGFFSNRTSSVVDPKLSPRTPFSLPYSFPSCLLSPSSSPLPTSLKSHLDYVFKNHLHAKDSKNYTSPQTTLLNSRLVCLTAYLTSFFPWISNRYFLKKHIQIRTRDLPSHSVPPAQPRYSVILLHVSKRYHYSPNCSGHKPLLILIFLLCSHF